jgi:amidase
VPVSDEVAARATGIGETLQHLGATVSFDARPRIDMARAHATYIKLLNSIMGAAAGGEAYAQFRQLAAGLDPADTSEAATTLRALVLDHRDWLRANNYREQLRYQWHEFFDDWDILICPQMATPAFPHDHTPMPDRSLEINGETRPYFEQVFWAGFAVAAYLPSTVFPSGPSAEGLPIGLQAVSAEYNDYTCIDFARLLAREIGGFRAPPGFDN